MRYIGDVTKTYRGGGRCRKMGLREERGGYLDIVGWA